ncbi:MAG: type ISP restriction/modification enzyme [Acidimicrobiales bacterium]
MSLTSLGTGIACSTDSGSSPIPDSSTERRLVITPTTRSTSFTHLDEALGAGPAVTATPYVPDLHYFRGSYGAKDVMPLYRDRRGKDPNVTNGLLEVIAEALGAEVEPEHLLAYVYGLAGSSAFTDRFTDELEKRLVRCASRSPRTLSCSTR